MTCPITKPCDPCEPYLSSSAPEDVRIPLQAIRGRGAATAMAHRFERVQREVVDDGWSHEALAAPGGEGEESAAQPTRVHLETARSALCANDSPDIFFELSVNPYRGCEHGCIFIAGSSIHTFGIF